ncbi:MAG: hypothetical protein ACREI9_13405, partial [Nitrospiraceae bacterium]
MSRRLALVGLVVLVSAELSLLSPGYSFAQSTPTFYLHGSGGTANPPTLFLDTTAPAGSTAKYKDSPSVNFNSGNPWQAVGTWSAAPALTAGP